jgi:hypothetical protein
MLRLKHLLLTLAIIRVIFRKKITGFAESEVLDFFCVSTGSSVFFLFIEKLHIFYIIYFQLNKKLSKSSPYQEDFCWRDRFATKFAIT